MTIRHDLFMVGSYIICGESNRKVRQAENLRATYNNWNKVLKYTAEAYDSAGYAAQKYQVYLDSIEGRTNTMVATYQDMVSNPVFENLIKNVITLIQKFGELVNKIGLVNIAFVAFSTVLGTVFKMSIPQLTAFFGIINSIHAAVRNLAAAIMAGGGISAAMSGLGAAMSAIAPIALAAAITLIVYKLVNYKSAAERAKEKVKELSNEEQEHITTLQTLNQQLEENKKRYEELDEARQLGTITDAQKSEMENLEKTNSLLKEQAEYEEALIELKKKQKEAAAEEAVKRASFETGKVTYTQVSDKGGKIAHKERVGIEDFGEEVKDTANKYAEKIAEAYSRGDEEAVEKIRKEAQAYSKKVTKFNYFGYVEGLDKTSEAYKTLTKNGNDVNFGINLLNGVLGTTSTSLEEYQQQATDATDATGELGDAVDATGGKADTMATIFSTATGKMNTFKSAQDEIAESGELSWATIQELISAYPQLTSKLYGYVQGLVSAKDISALLSEAYADQESQIESNLEASEDYYSTMIAGNSEMYEKFLENYNIDLSNYTTVQGLKADIQKEIAKNATAEEATKVDKLAEMYGIDLSNFADVAGKKIEIQRQLNSLINQEKENALKHGTYVHAGETTVSLRQSELEKAKEELGIVGVDDSVYDSISANIKKLSEGVKTKSAASSKDKSSGSESAIDPQDMTEAFIKAANAEAKLTANQGDSLERQIKQAESAKDYTKEIELQNKLLDNQNLHITQLQTANSKIHEEAERLRKASSYGEASKSWFDVNGEATSQYMQLLESFAGKTDKASKAQYKAITDLYESLYKLKQGWNDNTNAVYELQDAVASTKQTIDDLVKETAQKIADIEDQIVQMYEWEKEQKVDKAEKAKDKALDAAEEEYNKKKKFYEDELEEYEKMIQGKLDALEDEAATEDFNAELASKQEELADLQKQYNTLGLAAGTGDRVAQQQRQDLAEQIADKQEEVDKLVTDRNRSLQQDALNDSLSDYQEYIEDKQDVLDDSYDREQEKIEETYNKKVKKLEEAYSKEELYSKARKALMSGEYSSLQDLFEAYQKDQGEGWSSMGSILEDEFVSKLREAADLLSELEEGGITTSRLIKAISDSGGNSSSGSGSSRLPHETLGGGFEKMSDEDWEIYKANKLAYKNGTATGTQISKNASLRRTYGIVSDNYSYDDIKNYYASGTTRASGGLAMVGENGAELRVLNQGDGIIPSNLTSTIMSFAKNPSDYVKKLLYNTTPSYTANNNSLSIGSLVTIEGNVSSDEKVAEITKNVNNEVEQLYKYLKQSKPNIGFGY